MAKRREWNLQQQSRQIQQQIQRGESPQAAVSDTLRGGGGGGTATQRGNGLTTVGTQHGNDATTLGTAGADTIAGGGTRAGVAAVAGAEGAREAGGASMGRAGEAEDIDNQNFTEMRAGGATATGAAGGDTIPGGEAGGARGTASGSAMAARLVHRARGFATEVSDMLFRGVKKR